MKVEEQKEGYREIPGLPDSERGGKKGKKKNNSKKTLSLSNFPESNGKAPNPPPPAVISEAPENKPNKPPLSEKEQDILESCHTYIRDYLKLSGPMNAFDTGLQAEFNNFPIEAKNVIQKVGGLKPFILLCEDLLVVDKIVGAKVHSEKIKELAIRDVYNSIPGYNSSEKQIWNTNNAAPGSKVGEGSLSSKSGLSQDGAIQYQSTSLPGQGVGHIGDRTGSGQMMASRTPPGDRSPGQINNSGISRETVETYQKEIVRLSNQNQELLSKLAEKDKQLVELAQHKGRITQLELESEQARIQINKYREHIERLKSELAEAKSSQAGLGQENNKFSDNDRDLILKLQKQLDAEKLRNLNLSQQQVDGQLSGLSLSGQPSLNRQNSFVNLGQNSLETDPFGLRNMTLNSGVEMDLKAPPNLFGAIGSDIAKRNKTDMAPPVSSLVQGSSHQPSVAGGSSSYNLMKSASASTIGLSGSRGPSPITNFGGFGTAGLGMNLPGFSAGQSSILSSSSSLAGGSAKSVGGGVHSLAPGGLQSLAPSAVSQQAVMSSGQQALSALAAAGNSSPSLAALAAGGSSSQSLAALAAGGSSSQSLSSLAAAGNSSQSLAALAAAGNSSQSLAALAAGVNRGAPGLSSVGGQIGSQMGGGHGQVGGQMGGHGQVGGQGFGGMLLGGQLDPSVVPDHASPLNFLNQSSGLSSTFSSSQNSLGLSHLASQPQQVTPSGDLGNVVPDSAAATHKSNSAIRQDQLIKKLVATIPGATEEDIKHYIQVLRDRHGKLSGWSTTRITQEILALMNQEQKH